MVTKHQLLFDGVNLKSVSPWDVDSNVGWTILGGTQDAQGIDKLALRVPWLYRAWKDRSNNVGDMPWSIEKGDNEVSNSAEWAEDKPRELEFISNPRRLFAQIEKSLCIAGKAYLALEVNKSGYIKNVKYLAPQTIEEVYDKVDGHITGYKRSINNNTFECSLADQPPVAGQVQIVAIYDPDWMTEIGPGKSSDALAAMTPAGVLYSYDTFVANFFERGAIKASVLTVESASPGEQERLQHWWDDVVAGVKNAWSAIVLRGKMNAPVVIGEGLDGVENNELTTSRRQDICAAMGVPESRMWSAAANYATRKVDEVAYFRGTIIPDCNLIAEAMNEQVFNEVHKLNGYRLEFTPESLDIFQEDEAERASSLQQLTGAGVPLVTAMEILGYDLTDEQWDALKAEDEKPEPIPPVMVAPPVEPVNEADPDTDQDEQPAPIPSRDAEPATRAMLKNWKRKAIHALKLTRDPNVPWDTDLLPSTMVDDIRRDLSACETRAQIEGVFANVETETMQPVPLKYNENHGDDGRFTSGEGGGDSGGGGSSGGDGGGSANSFEVRETWQSLPAGHPDRVRLMKEELSRLKGKRTQLQKLTRQSRYVSGERDIPDNPRKKAVNINDMTLDELEALLAKLEKNIAKLENYIVTEETPLAGELKRASDLLERIMALPVQEYPARKAVDSPQFINNMIKGV